MKILDEPNLFLPDKTIRKQTLLNSLKGKSSYKYSRYGSDFLPLRYAGGKTLAVGHILENLPDTLEHLTSPFFGGGSVELACANELGISISGYDIFDILVNYWQIQLSQPEILADRISQWSPTKETYNIVKRKLKEHWEKERLIEDRIDLAAHYWWNHNLSYGPGFLGWTSRIYQEPERVARYITKVRNFRCPDTSVKTGSFENTIPAHSKDFLYCDPPYYLGENTKMFKGMYPHRNIPVHHNGFQHQILRDLLLSHKGGFVLSYNDCETIRDWYDDFRILEVEWQYTLGQGESRIGKNRIERGISHVKQSHELLIVKDIYS